LGSKIIRGQFYSIVSVLLLQFGLFFAFGGVARNEPIYSFLKSNHQLIAYISYFSLICNVIFIIWVYKQKSELIRKIIARLILVLSPLILVFVFHILSLILDPQTNQRISNSYSTKDYVSNSIYDTQPLTIILLFDELSPDYLYGSKKINLAPYPTLDNLVRNSNKFTNVYLDGGKTHLSVPALLNERNLGTTIKELLEDENLNPKIMGWALNYCNEITSKNKNCSSTSIFNARTLNDQFSLIHPFWTNLNLLPHQKPYGFLKIPAATAMHKATFRKTNAWLAKEVENPSTKLIYVHFNVPHAPMLDNETLKIADARRFNIIESDYIKQLKFVDEALKTLSDSLTKRPGNSDRNLIILSDHNVRTLTPKREHEHIPLIYLSGKGVIFPQKALDREISASELIISIITK
jgi:hypothetical protein